MTPRTAVLLMAYGTPRNLDEIEPYYTDIRRGRPPTAELLAELTDRYRAIGGHSPLLEITEKQALGLQERLGIPIYLGLKHASPFIPEAIDKITQDGIKNVVGLVLAPHYSAMSIGDYERRARAAMQTLGWNGELTMIDSWHLEAGYLDFLANEVRGALDSFSDVTRQRSTVVFTAHSLPERILREDDPYPNQLRETGEAVASLLELARWDIGWQSAGRTADPWIGPDILDVMTTLASEEQRGVVVCPCGFVSDHLEVLYDVDIECKERASALGIEFARTASPNDDPGFLDALAEVVRRRLPA